MVFLALREILALRHAMEEIKAKESWILTLSEQEEIHVVEGLIRVIPVYRWLLDEK